MSQGQTHTSKHWLKAQDVFALIYLYPVRALSYLFPVSFLCWLADRVSPLYGRLRTDIAVPVSRRMENCLANHENPTSPGEMSRSFLSRDLRKQIDDLIIRRLSQERMDTRANIQGIQFLDEVLAEGKGAIVISGHFHANRLAKYYLRRKGYSLMSIRNHVPTGPSMGKFGNRFVAPAYGRFLDAIVEDEIYLQDAGLGAGMLRRLRENGIVNIHIDSGMPMSNEVTFLQCLNETRRFPTGFLKLAELTGTPLVPMLCLGNSSGFEIRFGPPIRYTDKSAPEVFRDRLVSLCGILESWVRSHPEEWEVWPREN